MSDDISAEIAARQEEQKRKEKIIVSTIQQQTESKLNNGQNWETFDPLKPWTKEREQESKEIRKRIDNARKQILGKKLLADGRLDSINEFYEAIYGTSGTAIGGAVIGLIIENWRIGPTAAVGVGAGAVAGAETAAVATTTLPIFGFFLAAAIGAVSITGIVLLVKKLYTRHQEKAIKCSNKLLIELEKISEANAFFLSYIQTSKELVNNTLVAIASIQNGLCSERYRKNNAECCEAIIKDNKDMIETLNQISSINLEQWVSSLKIDEMVKIENSPETRSIDN
jgi:hypothetical protein